MTTEKNWWVTAYDGEGNIVEEWIIKNKTAYDASERAEIAIDNLMCLELDSGGRVEDWSIREALITIQVKNGAVTEVSGLPDGWLYEVIDHDIKEK